MIQSYGDHANNERTFLAWVRTGIAVMAFGFVIEKFNLFVATIAAADPTDAKRRLLLEKLSGPLGRYDGLVLILVGIVLIVFAAARFFHTARQLNDKEMHWEGDVRAELILSGVLTLIMAVFGIYLALG